MPNSMTTYCVVIWYSIIQDTHNIPLQQTMDNLFQSLVEHSNHLLHYQVMVDSHQEMDRD